MKQYRITVEGQTFDVALRGDPRQSQVQVEVNGELFTVEVASPGSGDGGPVPAFAPPPTMVATPAPPPAAAPLPAGGSGNTVVAPLPGLVKRIAVQAGQQVVAGEALLVIEAMKMDNTLRATRSGVVETVHAVEGRQVPHGAPLLTYK